MTPNTAALSSPHSLDSKTSGMTENTTEERRFYTPEDRLHQLRDYGTASIHRALETIRPVSIESDMLQVLEVFRGHQQEHFFPVLDLAGTPLGLIRERSLKSYVYSRYGMALLSNRGQPRQLDSFLTSCPSAEIDATIEQVLQAAHAVPGTEGVLITAGGRYIGFIRASALVEMAHEQQMEIIRQHNTELDQKNREIQAVLQNMRQGICTILPDLTLHTDFSAHLSSILEQEELAGAALMDTLFKHSELGPDALQQIEAALMAVLEQDAFMFDCNAHLLPTEVTVTLAGQRKILELHWNPMLNEQDEVSRLMLVVRDLSRMRELQQQADQQQHELQILSEILAAGESRFTAFMDASEQQLAVCRQLLDSTQDVIADEAQTILYRQLHTIKGNARTLGLMAVTDSLHDAEQVLQASRDSGADVSVSALQQALHQVSHDFSQYHLLYTSRLQGFGRDRDTQIVSNTLWQQLEQLASQRRDSELLALLQQASGSNLNAMLSALGESLSGIANELDKPASQLIVGPALADCHLSNKQAQRLSDAMVHILRNCLDHGIEPAAERLAMGKPGAGTVHVDGGTDGKYITLRVSDDGRGLALQRLRSKAIGAGLLRDDEVVSDDEIAELMFHSGLSTAGQVSMVSGRGVGMDAVRSGLAEIGGSIDLVWAGAGNDAGYRPFSLVICLPEACGGLPVA